MSEACEVQVAGETLRLSPDKALYWPARQLLCIADAHFGKAAAYRALGQPVPLGTTASNLLRLDALLARHATKRLVFLGDFFHAPESLRASTLSALHRWREQHAELDCTLIRGNHDHRAGDPPMTLQFEIVDEPLRIGPLALRHTPLAEPDCHVIAGHVHPVFGLQGRGRQHLRLPCFYSRPELTLMPAFGDFTGGYAVERTADSRIFVVEAGRIWPIHQASA